jgi:2Fe-2S iron-sulfur cluster binding domain
MTILFLGKNAQCFARNLKCSAVAVAARGPFLVQRRLKRPKLQHEASLISPIMPRPLSMKPSCCSQSGGHRMDKDYDVTAKLRRTLADVIRVDCGQTGTHIGCEHGICGACMVLVDGEPVRSCLIRRASKGPQHPYHRRVATRRPAAPYATSVYAAPCLAVRLLHAGLSDARVSSENGQTSMRRSSSISCRQISAAALATQTSSKPCVPAQLI